MKSMAKGREKKKLEKEREAKSMLARGIGYWMKPWSNPLIEFNTMAVQGCHFASVYARCAPHTPHSASIKGDHESRMNKTSFLL